MPTRSTTASGSIYFTLEYDPTTNGFWKSGHNPRWPYGIELLGLLLMEAPSLKHLCLENFEELLWMHELLGQIVTRFRELTSLTLRGKGPSYGGLFPLLQCRPTHIGLIFHPDFRDISGHIHSRLGSYTHQCCVSQRDIASDRGLPSRGSATRD